MTHTHPKSAGQRRRMTKEGQLGLTREEWIEAAREILINHGYAAVKIDRIARRKRVTRGGFYWRFKGLRDLQDALVADWRKTNSQPILEILKSDSTPLQRFREMQIAFIEEKQFSPAYDAAMREWGRSSRRVATIVRRVDDERIDALRALFAEVGYSRDEAFIRARITYFHQLGYYAMEVHESTQARLEMSALYYKVLTGFPISAKLERIGEDMSARIQ